MRPMPCEGRPRGDGCCQGQQKAGDIRAGDEPYREDSNIERDDRGANGARDDAGVGLHTNEVDVFIFGVLVDELGVNGI